MKRYFYFSLVCCLLLRLTNAPVKADSIIALETPVLSQNQKFHFEARRENLRERLVLYRKGELRELWSREAPRQPFFVTDAIVANDGRGVLVFFASDEKAPNCYLFNARGDQIRSWRYGRDLPAKERDWLESLPLEASLYFPSAAFWLHDNRYYVEVLSSGTVRATSMRTGAQLLLSPQQTRRIFRRQSALIRRRIQRGESGDLYSDIESLYAMRDPLAIPLLKEIASGELRPQGTASRNPARRLAMQSLFSLQGDAALPLLLRILNQLPPGERSSWLYTLVGGAGREIDSYISELEKSDSPVIATEARRVYWHRAIYQGLRDKIKPLRLVSAHQGRSVSQFR